MAFQLNSIVGSLTAAQLAQQADTANEQEQTRLYRQEMRKELARHAQQTEEEVSAANQEGHRRIGDRPARQRRRQGDAQPERDEASGPEPDEEFGPGEPHLLDVRDNDTAPARRPEPAPHVDLTA